MLLSLKINNCLIFNSEVEFSMRANKNFNCNVTTNNNVTVLKTAILIGPNNSGKTNFIRIIAALKEIMLGRSANLNRNLFSDNSVVEVSISFLQNGKENLFEFRLASRHKQGRYNPVAKILHTADY